MLELLIAAGSALGWNGTQHPPHKHTQTIAHERGRSCKLHGPDHCVSNTASIASRGTLHNVIARILAATNALRWSDAKVGIVRTNKHAEADEMLDGSGVRALAHGPYKATLEPHPVLYANTSIDWKERTIPNEPRSIADSARCRRKTA